MSDFIDDEIQREGGATETNDPADPGGRTKYGISEHAHPEAWTDGDVTYQEARDIYEKEYIMADHFNLIQDQSLQHQVVDFGVLHGVDSAARVLQQIVGVTVDGIIGQKTLDAIAAYPAGTLFGVAVPGSVLLNLAFRDARIMCDATLTKKNPTNLKFLLGWLRRALEFK